METALMILRILSMLVGFAEWAFPDKGEGPKKKDMVMRGAETLVKGMGMVSTGGQKETWSEIGLAWDSEKESVSNIVDYTVDMMFGKSK